MKHLCEVLIRPHCISWTRDMSITLTKMCICCHTIIWIFLIPTTDGCIITIHHSIHHTIHPTGHLDMGMMERMDTVDMDILTDMVVILTDMVDILTDTTVVDMVDMADMVATADMVVVMEADMEDIEAVEDADKELQDVFLSTNLIPYLKHFFVFG